ncbi:MAG TPA: hydrolase, partial [Oscillibacter sp.]|nr:hydrolase [Oscillibacter sp.]
AALAEIQKTDETLRAILGDGDYWLRPPWGFASDALKSAVSVPLIYWT